MTIIYNFSTNDNTENQKNITVLRVFLCKVRHVLPPLCTSNIIKFYLFYKKTLSKVFGGTK